MSPSWRQSKQISLDPPIWGGGGVVLRLLAGSEHLSFDSLLPISRSPDSSPVCSQLPRWLHRPVPMPTRPEAPSQPRPTLPRQTQKPKAAETLLWLLKPSVCSYTSVTVGCIAVKMSPDIQPQPIMNSLFCSSHFSGQTSSLYRCSQMMFANDCGDLHFSAYCCANVH